MPRNAPAAETSLANDKYTYKQEDPLFAVKSLNPLLSEDMDKDKAFRLEVKALLKVKSGPHLEVNLLTTFEYNNRYHLLFRWADGGSLEKLWNEHFPRPGVTYNWICWMVQQCQGLADGLSGIHDTKMTAEDLEVFQSSQVSPTAQNFAEAPPGNTEEDDDGRYYGRHGDIKPQNVLWFKQDENQYGLGVLKLADF